MSDSTFQREDRYIVIKRTDLGKVPVAYRKHLVEPLFSLQSHLPQRECVVVESDWPEYRLVWAMLEHRMAGKPVPDFNAWRRADELQQRLTVQDQRVDELLAEREFLLKEMREMAQALPYAMVEWSNGPHEMTPELDTYKWFWWNGTSRPIYKNALCDVVLSDGSIHFNVPPEFDWSRERDPHVVMARTGPNLDFIEDIDRPAELSYPALNPTAEAEPKCLLCLDKKTVPGNIPGGFVKDCPDCCGEEG